MILNLINNEVTYSGSFCKIALSCDLSQYYGMVDCVQEFQNRGCYMHVNNITKIQYREKHYLNNVSPILNTEA